MISWLNLCFFFLQRARKNLCTFFFFLVYGVHINHFRHNHFFLPYCNNLFSFFVFFWFTVCTSIIFFFSIVRIYILSLFFVYTSIIFFFYKNLCTFFFFFSVYSVHFRIKNQYTWIYPYLFRIYVLFFFHFVYSVQNQCAWNRVCFVGYFYHKRTWQTKLFW